METKVTTMSELIKENMETLRICAGYEVEVPGFEFLGRCCSYKFVKDDEIQLYFNKVATGYKVKITNSMLELGYSEFEDEILDFFNAYLTGYYDNFNVKVLLEMGFTHKEDFKTQLPNIEKCIEKSREDGNYPSLVESIRRVLTIKRNAGKGSQLGMSFCNYGDPNDISFTVLTANDKYYYGGGIINHGSKFGWSIHS